MAQDNYQKWEYKTDYRMSDYLLNEFGKQGWELCAVDNEGKYILKRLVGSKPTVADTSEWSEKPLGDLLAELDRIDAEGLGHDYKTCKSGYAKRLSQVCQQLNITTIGKLVAFGSRGYRDCRNVGKKSAGKIGEALNRLYGISNW